MTETVPSNGLARLTARDFHRIHDVGVVGARRMARARGCPAFVVSARLRRFGMRSGGQAWGGQRGAIREGGRTGTSLRLRSASTPDDVAEAAIAFRLPGFRRVFGETPLVDAGMRMTVGE